MSQSELERFARDLKTNAALLADVRTKAGDALSAVVDIGTRHGYRFTLDDARAFVAAKAKAKGVQLTESDLDRVAGGGGKITGCSVKSLILAADASAALL